MRHGLGALVSACLAVASVTAVRAATVQGRIVVLNYAGKQVRKPQPPVVFWLNPLSATRETSGAVNGKGVRNRFQLVQKDKRFDPHVLIVPVGSAIDFPNRDPFFHNVFSFYDGKRFDLGLYEAGSTRNVVFDKPGVSYIFCNIHSEMSAVVIAVSTPYYGISDPHGRVSIAGVPPGRYTLRIWYEETLPEALNNMTREVTVSEDASSLGAMRLPATSMPQGHQNMYGRDYPPPLPDSPSYERH
jgi:plastocyanin